MFCRMCNTHQCTEHLCLHLNVAWEQNSWTKRHERELHEYQTSESDISSEASSWDEETDTNSPPESTTAPPLPSTPKPLCAYSEAQLREQYHFYTTQARRIRIELERRTLPASGAVGASTKQRTLLPRRDSATPVAGKRSLGKGATASYELLLSRLRTGSITLDYIQSKLESE